MTVASWIVLVSLVALVVLAVIATRRGWLRDTDRPEDRVSRAALGDVARNRAGSGTSL